MSANASVAAESEQAVLEEQPETELIGFDEKITDRLSRSENPLQSMSAFARYYATTLKQRLKGDDFAMLQQDAEVLATIRKQELTLKKIPEPSDERWSVVWAQAEALGQMVERAASVLIVPLVSDVQTETDFKREELRHIRRIQSLIAAFREDYETIDAILSPNKNDRSSFLNAAHFIAGSFVRKCAKSVMERVSPDDDLEGKVNHHFIDAVLKALSTNGQNAISPDKVRQIWNDEMKKAQ